jgi:hypothetical protein
MGFDDSGEMKKQGFGEKEPHWDEKIKWFAFPADAEEHSYRLIAKQTYYAQHWIPTIKKDGTPGKSFPVICKNYDSANSKWAENGCEACSFLDLAWKAVAASEKGKPVKKDAEGKIIKAKPPERIAKSNRRITMASNAIIRELQEQGAPANNTGQWTFVHPIRIPQGAADKIVEAQAKYGVKKPDGSGHFGFNDKTHGKDLGLTFNPDAAVPAEMYVLGISKDTPVKALTEEEMKHAPHLVDFLKHLKYPKAGELTETFKRNGFTEWLENIQAQANLQQINKGSDVTPPADAPAANAAAPDAFESGGGIPPSGEPQGAPSDSEPAAPATQVGNVQVDKPEEDLPVDLGELKGGPAKSAAAPAAEKPVAAKAEAAPAAAAPAAAKAPTSSDLAAKILTYCTDKKKETVVSDKEFKGDLALRFYKPGMTVPACFSKYSANDKPTCRPCPLRLDCMMTDGE